MKYFLAVTVCVYCIYVIDNNLKGGDVIIYSYNGTNVAAATGTL